MTPSRPPFSRLILSEIVVCLLLGAAAVTIAWTRTSSIVHRSTDTSNGAEAVLLMYEVEESLLRLRVIPPIFSESTELTRRDVLDASNTMGEAQAASVAVMGTDGSPRTFEVLKAVNEAEAALNQYLVSSATSDRDEFLLRLAHAEGAVAKAEDELSTQMRARSDELVDAAILGRTIGIPGAFLIVTLVGTTVVALTRRMNANVQALRVEKESLSTLTRSLNRRSEQLAALYQVVGEVTDNLSLKYVVNTTVQEARKLVGADLVALRLLHANVLELAGIARTSDSLAASLGDIPLGVGLVGRAAKRGKTLRIDEGAEQQMTENERVEAIQSGLVVPLIVGARVVGTLGCWSRATHQFTADDERILEMMASQVATAVVAAELHEDSERQAHHDALTGVPNRWQLTADIKGYLTSLTEGEEPFLVLMADIDHFKRFNDEFGHRVGDVTLQKVAQVLKSSIREADRVYRYGGEEFLLILAGVSGLEARAMVERIRNAVAQTPLTGENLEPVGPVTISLGGAAYPSDGVAIPGLISLADKALYVAKERGRNTTVFAAELDIPAAA